MSSPTRPRAATDRDPTIMHTPSLREHWPILPVVRHRNDGAMDTGLMYDTRGAARLAGLAATVFIGNIFLLPKTRDEFLELPKETFDTFEEVVAAGWRVD